MINLCGLCDHKISDLRGLSLFQIMDEIYCNDFLILNLILEFKINEMHRVCQVIMCLHKKHQFLKI